MKKVIYCLLLALFLLPAWAGNKRVTIEVNQMTCTLCVISINKALRSIDGVIKAKASLQTHQVDVIVPENFDNQRLLAAIAQTGFTGMINNVSNM